MGSPVYNPAGNLSAMARIQNAQARFNEPTSCPKCGSLFFVKHSAYMFTGKGDYGYRVNSVTPMELIICICGHLMLPKNAHVGATKGSEREAFVLSVNAALEHREKNAVPNLASLTENLASHAELVALEGRVNDVFAILANGGGVEIEEVPVQEQAQESSQETFEGDPEVPDTPEEAPAPAPVKAAEPAQPARNGKQIGVVETVTRREILKPGGARARMKRQGE